MSKRSRKSDELDAALRAEPDYQELVTLLKRQAPSQKARTARWLTEQAAKQEGLPVSTDKKALDQRIIYLKDKKRLSWPAIATRLQAEGFPTMKDQAVRKRYERAEKPQAAQPRKSQRRPPDPAQVSQPSQPAKISMPPGEPCEPAQPSQIPLEWLDPLRALVREEIRNMGAKPLTVATIADVAKDSPPERPRKGRKLAGRKVTFPGTRIDTNLAAAFEAERRRLQLSASELLEIILWRALGRPPLSYQTTESRDRDA